MRLQVFLSHAGVSARRKTLELIKAGRVTVNNKKIYEPSYPVKESDLIVFDGRRLVIPEPIYLLLNKPKGVVTTVSDPFAEKTVMDLLPKKFSSLHPVGRLDKDTSGLLLLTNDGALTHRLIHPSFEVEKTYRVCLDRPLTQDDWRRLEKGVLLDDKKTAPCQIQKNGPCAYEMIIHEGRKRQIRRMFAALRYYVRDLSRIRQGTLALGDLKPGDFRPLTKEEVARLKRE